MSLDPKIRHDMRVILNDAKDDLKASGEVHPTVYLTGIDAEGEQVFTSIGIMGEMPDSAEARGEMLYELGAHFGKVAKDSKVEIHGLFLLCDTWQKTVGKDEPTPETLRFDPTAIDAVIVMYMDRHDVGQGWIMSMPYKKLDEGGFKWERTVVKQAEVLYFGRFFDGVKKSQGVGSFAEFLREG